MPLLTVSELTIDLISNGRSNRVVDDVSFTIESGQTLCLVGESGSGKSVTALSLLGLLDNARYPSGAAAFNGIDLIRASERELCSIRGGCIGMVFQEPLTSLNPAMRIGRQITEIIRTHRKCTPRAATVQALELLRQVGIADPDRRIHEYPHQLSGGMRQRVVIAMAISCEPQLLIADEPTTALDATIQAQILDLLRRLSAERNMAMLFISHDMGVIAQMADRVAVMYGGKIVEQGTADEIFHTPQMPYTWSLLRSVPRFTESRRRYQAIPGRVASVSERTVGCAFAPRCPVTIAACSDQRPPLVDRGGGHQTACHLTYDEFQKRRALIKDDSVKTVASEVTTTAPLMTLVALSKEYASTRWTKRSGVRALDSVNLQLNTGEMTGLVGESGCGKSTLASLAVRLIEPSGGSITFAGSDLTTLRGNTLRKIRRDIQLVAQDPFSSLDPTWTVGSIVAEPLRIHGFAGSVEARSAELLERVGLHASDGSRYPREFSGGQRQRIAIARAIASNPRLVVLDEPVAALDVSIRAQILNLLADLQREEGLTLLFISHDLAVVRQSCTRVAVMYLGRIVEQGPTDILFDTPLHPYTSGLLAAVPVPDPADERSRPRIILGGEVPSPRTPPSGCHFHPRCVRATELCTTTTPELRTHGSDHHLARCHHPLITQLPVETSVS